MALPYAELSAEQRFFVDRVFEKSNVLVDATIGSGKTTAIQSLCDALPSHLRILYLTYNRLLKVDAKQKITNSNVLVTNYHGFVYPYLQQAGIRCGLSDSISKFNQAKLRIPKFDIMIVDEYQDIELDFAEMLEYIKSTNPSMQIIFVGDMAQKIYDKTTLKVEEWAKQFMGERLELEFTQCFRLSEHHAAMLGRVWNKTIIGVNPQCCVRKMQLKEINDYISRQNPGDIICLGAKTGQMSKSLNYLERYHNDKFNKNTVYATIQDRDANINPNSSTAIFTTFDSSKGMEKPICVVFDWDEHYWQTRNKQPSANYTILKNIFCVAASRGKSEIIFVTGEHEQLTEQTLSKPLAGTKIKKAHISDMFDFKFTEEIDKCLGFLNISPVKHENSREIIDIPNADGLIDLTPCIGIYQEASFFKKFDMEKALNDAFSKREFPLDKKLLKQPTDVQILNITALETYQNRYKYQVSLPFVEQSQRNQLHERLREHLSPDDYIQLKCEMNLEGIEISGRCDAIHDDMIWELKFVTEIKREHYLQLAMYLIGLQKQKGRLWNTRDNNIFDVSIKPGQEQAFLTQVARTVRKDTFAAKLLSQTIRTAPYQPTLSGTQQTAVNRYRKNYY